MRRARVVHNWLSLSLSHPFSSFSKKGASRLCPPADPASPPWAWVSEKCGEISRKWDGGMSRECESACMQILRSPISLVTVHTVLTCSSDWTRMIQPLHLDALSRFPVSPSPRLPASILSCGDTTSNLFGANGYSTHEKITKSLLSISSPPRRSWRVGPSKNLIWLICCYERTKDENAAMLQCRPCRSIAMHSRPNRRRMFAESPTWDWKSLEHWNLPQCEMIVESRWTYY